MAYQRTHPIMILLFIRHFFYLLLIPTVRGLVYALSSDFWAWLSSAWIDLLVVAALLIFSILRWMWFGYCVAPDGLYLRSGLLFRREVFVARRSICSIVGERSWLGTMLGAQRMTVKTVGGGPKRPWVSFYVTHRQLARIAEQCGFPTAKPTRVYRPAYKHTALFAALDSSSLAGVVLFSAFLMRTGAQISQTLQKILLGTMKDLVAVLQPWVVGVPTVAITVSLVLLFGWAVGFVHALLYHGRMQIDLRRERLVITAGIVSRRRYRLDRERITYMENRQSVIGRLLRLDTVYMECPGYTNRRGRSQVLLLSAPKRESQRLLERLLPQFHARPIRLRPSIGSMPAYLLLPFGQNVLFWLLAPAAERFVKGLLRPFSASLHTLPDLPFSILWIPLLWYAVVHFVGFFAAGVGGEGGLLTVCYPKGWRIRTVTVQMKNLRVVKIRQSRWQKRFGRCTLVLYTGRDRSRRHCVPGLPVDEVLRLLGISGNEMER